MIATQFTCFGGSNQVLRIRKMAYHPVKKSLYGLMQSMKYEPDVNVEECFWVYFSQFVKQENIFGWWNSNPQLFYAL